METTETQVARTLLQQPVEITIGAKTYEVAPPSVATLILASEVVSRLPHESLNDKKVVEETLSIAKDCGGLGELIAILILGAKHVNDIETRRVRIRKPFLRGLLHRTREVTVSETAKERLSRELLEDNSPRDLHNAIAALLRQMQIGDFFGLTTFLTEINLIRPTKVVTKAIASGR